MESTTVANEREIVKRLLASLQRDTRTMVHTWFDDNRAQVLLKVEHDRDVGSGASDWTFTTTGGHRIRLRIAQID